MNKNLSEITQVVVVTYNPEIELLKRNLHALIKQFDNILVVDNDSKNIAEIDGLVKKTNSKIKLRKLQDNMGIAYAQNRGLEEAINNELDWLLTMDQDSIIPENLTSEYQKILDYYNHIGLVAWKQENENNKNDEIKNDWFIISSGCLNNVSALKECGGFDDKLFIDHVDTDANIKIRNLGYQTLTTGKVRLIHQLGTKTDKKTIRGKAYNAHSPIRVYYIVRNGVVLFKRYFFKQPFWSMIAIKNNFREGMYLLNFQPNKMKNLKLLVRAWGDGIFNRLGKFRD